MGLLKLMKPTIYCIGLIYNFEGTKVGLFNFENNHWPCLVKMKGVDKLAERFKQATEKLFEQTIEWQNVKPMEVNWPILPCKSEIQLFRTHEPGLIYACELVISLDKINNNDIAELLKENSFI